LNDFDRQEAECPADVVDPLLWRGAQRILDRHVLQLDGTCRWCGWQGPCSPRRLAQRAEAKARRGWHEEWIARNEISRLLPAPETEFVAIAPTQRPRNEREFSSLRPKTEHSF
jgi:hypothetical protein